MKNRFLKLVLAGICLFSSVGVLTACNEDPVDPPATEPPSSEQPGETPPVQSTTYTLIFDEDNDSTTQNQTKTVEKTAINNRSTWPTLPEKNGYAGEWVKKSQDGDTITLIANYGNGSAENPYLIATAEQLHDMITATKNFTVAYTNGNYSAVAEASAVRKIFRYNTADVVYVKDSNSTESTASWTLMMGVATNKLHYRLVNDIDISTFSEASCGGAASIVLDGAKYDLDGNIIDRYTLKNFTSSSFDYLYNNGNSTVTYSGNMFEMVIDSTFKNLKIELTGVCGGLAFMARDGQTTFENIEVNASTDITKGNNTSVFVSHIMSNCYLVMKDLTNNANYVGDSGSYNGIFVGGYAQYGTSATFINCVNNGNIVTSGTCGFFFGNTARKVTNLIVKDCVNNGTIIADNRTHMLVPLVDSSRYGIDHYDETNVTKYDQTVEGEFTQNGEVILVTSTSTASVDGSDLIISNNSNNLTAGTYEIVISRNMFGVDGTHTRRFYLPVKEVIVDGSSNSITVEDVFYNVIDIQSFLEDGNQMPEPIEWHNIEHSPYRWAKDDATQSYIIDTNGEFILHDTDRMIFTITVRNAQQEIVEVITKTGLIIE